MRPIHTLIIHCSATRPEWMGHRAAIDKAREIHRWHLDRGWSGIGYHKLIDRDGSVIRCRRVPRPGAHVKGHNRHSIGVVLIGGHGSAATDQFSAHFTPAQDAALRGVIAEYRHSFGKLKLRGHNDFAAKACPGFNVGDWYRQHSSQRTELAA